MENSQKPPLQLPTLQWRPGRGVGLPRASVPTGIHYGIAYVALAAGQLSSNGWGGPHCGVPAVDDAWQLSRSQLAPPAQDTFFGDSIFFECGSPKCGKF